MTLRTYEIRAGRLGGDGWRAAIVLPSRHGEITVSATVPDGAIAAWRAGLRDLAAGGVHGDAPTLRDTYAMSRDVGCACVGDVIPAIQAGLSALGPWGAAGSAALGVISNLFGGGPPPPRYDPNRPASLPAPGSVANLARILAHVGVRDGMPVTEARQRLETGVAQRWNENDANDGRRLVAVLPPGGAVRVAQLAELGAAQAREAAMPRPAPSPSPSPVPRATARPIAPAPALVRSLAGLVSDQMPPAAMAPLLATPAVLAQAAELAQAAPGLFEGDTAQLWSDAFEAADAVAGVELHGDPRAARALRRAELSRDPVLRDALASARALHAWMHEHPVTGLR